MIRTGKRLSLAAASEVLAAAVVLSGCQDGKKEPEMVSKETKSAEAAAAGMIFPPPLKIAKHLYVIKGDDLREEEWVLAGTLQGIVAQEQAEIYIDNGSAYTVWLEDMKRNYGITYEYVPSVWDLVAKFKGKLAENGFVQYKRANTSTVNAATTVSGALKYVAVEESLAEQAVRNGLVKKLDVSEKDEMWAVREYGDKLNKNFIFKQAYKLNSLRDYGPAVKGFYLYESNITDAKESFDWSNPNSAVMGWYPDEMTGVDTSSRLGKMTVASDHAYKEHQRLHEESRSEIRLHSRQRNDPGGRRPVCVAGSDPGRFLLHRPQIRGRQRRPVLVERQAVRRRQGIALGDGTAGNGRPAQQLQAGPGVIEGYTMVNVQPWSHNYQDVLDIAASLDPNVVIVTPDEFMELIKKNVKQENVAELQDVTESITPM